MKSLIVVGYGLFWSSFGLLKCNVLLLLQKENTALEENFFFASLRKEATILHWKILIFATFKG